MEVAAAGDDVTQIVHSDLLDVPLQAGVALVVRRGQRPVVALCRRKRG